MTRLSSAPIVALRINALYGKGPFRRSISSQTISIQPWKETLLASVCPQPRLATRVKEAMKSGGEPFREASDPPLLLGRSPIMAERHLFQQNVHFEMGEGDGSFLFRSMRQYRESARGSPGSCNGGE